MITTTMNLNSKLGYRYLSFQKKFKIFQRHMSLKAFFHFPNVRMRTNVFGEGAIADHKVEEQIWITKINCRTTGGVLSQI